MIHFLHNIGDFFASNYFDENFGKKVIEKSGYSTDAVKDINQRINQLKPEYFKLKQRFIENHLRVKDKINLSHDFHSKVLRALGYDAEHTQYNDLFPINDKSVLPIRHILYRGDRPHLMVMEMHAMIKTKDEEEPDGLFEQSYTSSQDGDEKTTKEQKYHRSQWADIFSVSEDVSISPMIINQAVNKLFLLPEQRRPHYVLLCAGNQYFLLEAEKWRRGSYLQLDLEALFDDAAITKDYYSIFYLLLGKDLLAPTAEMVLMEQLDEDSHKAAYEVTKDLKEGVIHAVESLANEAVKDLETQGVQPVDIDASKLKDDCLNMVYRLLFLFYAESREDLDILPSNDEVYDRGYSLEMLRDLEQVPLITESSLNGYFFHQSLFQLFDLLNKGYHENEGSSKSFKIRHLDSPMFDSSLLHYLNRVKIRNQVWQDVICELSLSKKQNKKSRGRISYANLGINQLGSVYESLLAFRGFLAETDYIEVHRKRKSNESSEKVVNTDGSYLVPRHRLDDFDSKEVFYNEKEDAPDELKVIPKGTFIYRLSGRDRQKSASYYTPEVLTQTTVKYTLKPILERLDKREIQALDLLQLKILEPAMGAAAFHNEVINQLAQAYLTYRQQELKQQVDPNKYQEEIQKIKAYIALNNVYGVDLNPTAIELGKLSLWLNVIHKDMQTPFFGYRLGVGNAVVGSWLKVFKHKDFSFEPKGVKGFVKKEWWTQAPKHLQFGKKGILRRDDEIYHFILPDAGMASSGSIKLLKDAFPERATRISEWRKAFCAPLRNDEFQRVQRISKAIDVLLLAHYDIQKNINQLTVTKGDFFGAYDVAEQAKLVHTSYHEKEEFAKNRLKPNAPYYKLKQMMDYWCSLWFWDVRDAEHLPTREEWYTDLEQLLNIDLTEITNEETLEEETVRVYRKDKKQLEKQLAEALKQSTSSLFTNERADLIQTYAEQYKFFHYELEFIEVFRENNGFDITVGNPPWIKINFDIISFYGDFDPKVIVEDLSASEVRKVLSKNIFVDEKLKNEYFEEEIYYTSVKEYFNSKNNFQYSEGKSNLYKLVLENVFFLSKNVGLVVDEGIFSDINGGYFRSVLYKRLSYLFRFNNELKLFSEVGNAKKYEILTLRESNEKVDFISIANLYHTVTVDQCFTVHSASILGMRDENNSWEIRGNRTRLINVNKELLESIFQMFDINSPTYLYSRLPLLHDISSIKILKSAGYHPYKVRDIKEVYSTQMINETNGEKDGVIERVGSYVDKDEFIISAPHFYVGTPYNKEPNEGCRNHRDYHKIDLTQINEDFIPRSVFRLLKRTESHNNYFHIHRRRVLNTNERTLISTIYPPNYKHTNNCISITFKELELTLSFSFYSLSIVYDFLVRITGSGDMWFNIIENLPIFKKINPFILHRGLRLTCLSIGYEELWNNHSNLIEKNDTLVSSERFEFNKSDVSLWDWDTPYRNDLERRQALIEIDVLVALEMGLTLDDLIRIYIIQFPVMNSYEAKAKYDLNGNLVDKDYNGETLTFNRVEDYKRAWVHFEEKFK